MAEFPAETKKNSLLQKVDLPSLVFPTERIVFAFLTSASRAVYSAHSTFLILLYHYLMNTENYATLCRTVLSSLLSLPSY